ncbi:MAG: FG-GAP-like repeat-containing protein [Saprospiraceae bacterium]
MKLSTPSYLVMAGLFVLTQLPAQPVPVVFSNQGNLLANIQGFTFYSSCAVDMNGDYLDDIVRVTNTALHVDFQQPDGTFQHTAFPMNVQKGPDWSICAGDLDNNGFNDLLFGNGEAVSFVKANATGTAYTETVMPDFIFSQRSTMADIDNDGWLDAFVCHDIDQSIPYRNDGTGNMSADQTLIQTIDQPGNYAAIWVDYDNDHDIDLYVTKCRGGAQPGDPTRTNRLYRNNGDGTFTEVGAQAGLDDNAQSWSTVFEDFDNDGDFDAFIVNHDFKNRLFRNNGDGTFTDVIVGSGIDANNLGAWENSSGDFNNDGYVDIFSELTQQLYLNNGDMTFTGQTVPTTPGAIGDFNNDGFLDVNRGNSLMINQGNGHHWLKVTTAGIFSNHNGIGARVEIYGAWGQQVREVRSGTSFSPMSTLNTHFGIGLADHIDSVIVRWPSGIVSIIENPAVDATLQVIEVKGLLAPTQLSLNGGHQINGETTLCPGETLDIIAPAGFVQYKWSNGQAAGPVLTVSEAGTYSCILLDADGFASFSDTLVVYQITEEPAPTIAVDGNTVFCEGGTLTLTASEGENYLWSNGMTDQSITVSTSDTLQVSVDAVCSVGQLSSAPIVVKVLPAPAPVVMDVLATPGDAVLLTATGENLYWYDQAQGGDFLATGPSYQAPPPAQLPATFYVESHPLYMGEMQTGGKPNNVGTGGLPAQGSYTLFNVWEPFYLRTVTVYVPNNAPVGERTIQLYAGDMLLDSLIVSLDQGQHEVDLNFYVPIGIDLSLRCKENNLYRNNGGVAYPYPIGDVGEMTTSYLFGDNFYYYFYNWQIQKEDFECVSERVPVTVMLSGLEEAGQEGGMEIYPNPAHEVLNVSIQTLGSGPVLLRLFSATGTEVLRKEVTSNQVQTIAVKNLLPGMYVLQATAEGRALARKIVVE